MSQPLVGKIILITGGTNGIGKATALELASRGAELVLACRNLDAGEQVREEIRGITGRDAARVAHLDLSDLTSVQRCAESVVATTPGIDVLINNAGGIRRQRALTPQGLEETFAVNYLGHYALTRRLLSHLRRDPICRVINVSSIGHRFSRGIRWDDLAFERRWTPVEAYTHAKLAQVLFTRELARRHGPDGVIAHAVHPGFVHTNFYADADRAPVIGPVARLILRRFALSPEEGATTAIHLATSDQATSANGLYWSRGRPTRPARAARNPTSADRLWRISDQLIAQAEATLPSA
ncbi:SDR family oxidoreductase [Frankia sp. CNm7]|uniref:SDR family oxidoreductase n=1 Tax=Frankia nepalensis TaxID=1836974 RepID=A0A937RST3_9ACTN|nr:SDR family oxidoreductase [Frankia nepalensis]MBL7501160.1 SDR family oxidoreductase [Frankia nepalensis]MBL7512638.1 SDR family oxidoreductase [Frankia nepalensis]MBL7518591.1 SDR family oxidoreductase [Frankia nepalensis]MBL7632694.1 SDR family oxidoreductase [Frankia nepalensis]